MLFIVSSNVTQSAQSSWGLLLLTWSVSQSVLKLSWKEPGHCVPASGRAVEVVVPATVVCAPSCLCGWASYGPVTPWDSPGSSSVCVEISSITHHPCLCLLCDPGLGHPGEAVVTGVLQRDTGGAVLPTWHRHCCFMALLFLKCHLPLAPSSTLPQFLFERKMKGYKNPTTSHCKSDITHDKATAGASRIHRRAAAPHDVSKAAYCVHFLYMQGKIHTVSCFTSIRIKEKKKKNPCILCL